MAILPNLETKGSSYFGLLCGSTGLLQLRPVEAGAVTKALGRIGPVILHGREVACS